MIEAEQLKAINSPDRTTLVDADASQLGMAVLALTREVWSLTDRIMVTQSVLARHGIDIAAEIEAFQPDAQMQQRLDEAGGRLVANVLNALAGLPAGEQDG